MNKMMTFTFVSLLSVAALASGQRLVPNSTGSAKIYTRPDLAGANTLLIEGAAAETLFNKMSDDLTQSVDASERSNGKRLVWKEGKNIWCDLEVAGPRGQNKYRCSIQIQDVSTGEVGTPGVG